MTSVTIDRTDGLNSAAAIKGPCRAATVGNITLAGQQTIDGVAVVAGDRVLVKDQASGSENGIWVADTGPWRRSKDFNRAKDVVEGTIVFVTSGTTNGDKSFAVTTANPISVGTTTITFARAFATAGQGDLADTALQPRDDVGDLDYAILAAPTVKRPASEKLFETKSLLDYGGRSSSVLGDPDNTAAWNDAVEDLTTNFATGGRLYLPSGRYGALGQRQIPKTAGKALEIAGEGRGTILDISGAPSGISAASFYVGSTDPNPPANIVIRDLLIAGDDTTDRLAFEAQYAHSLLLLNVDMEFMRVGLGLTNSFAVTLDNCLLKSVGNVGIYSDTAAHNLVLNRVKGFGVGIDDPGSFLRLDVATDNVVIRDGDFEGCRQVANFAGGGSQFLFSGNYAEYCTVPMLAFNAAMYGASIADNWLAVSPDLALANMIGGEFRRNRLYNHKVSFASSSRDVASSDIKLDGTATFTPCAATTVASFLAGATSDGTFPVRYSKRDGWVELGGLLNVVSMDNTAFVLPADYRPAIQQKFTIQSQSGNIGYVIIGSNGNVVPNVPGQATAWLDGVRFFCGK